MKEIKEVKAEGVRSGEGGGKERESEMRSFPEEVVKTLVNPKKTEQSIEF